MDTYWIAPKQVVMLVKNPEAVPTNKNSNMYSMLNSLSVCVLRFS